jgi:DnaJ-class molecular chaperone
MGSTATGNIPAAAADDVTETMALSPEDLVELERIASVMEGSDYFQLFGLTPAASPAEIKKAFYRESRRFHPDRFFHLSERMLKDHIHEVYKRITEAYAVLRDDIKRQKYVTDITGPERAQKLRFTEASEVEAKQQARKAQEEQIGVTPKGRQFYAAGSADFDGGRWAAAERNLKMALTFEPQNARYKEKLAEAQARLQEEAKKTGQSFKVK